MAISTEEMRARQQAEQGANTNIAQAIQAVSERAQILVREEIELAKAEVTAKVSQLVRGAAIGAAAGIFVVIGLLFLFHALSWGFAELLNHAWLGYLITAVILFLLGALAGFGAYRAFKSGAPPTPDMAIEEAKRIRETVTSDRPEQTI